MAATPYDILRGILTVLYQDGDVHSLCCCARANSLFNEVASSLLYSRVIFCPSYERTKDIVDLDLGDAFQELKYSQLNSAISPRNASYVRMVEVHGCLSHIRYPTQAFGELLVRCFRLLPNLHAVKFSPMRYHPTQYSDIISVLSQRRQTQEQPPLTELYLGHSAMLEPAEVSAFGQLTELRKLTLLGPTRALVSILPSWLKNLTSSLSVLELTGECRNITPEVLLAMAPHLQDRLHTFSLGTVPGVTHKDLFGFLGKLTRLENLSIEYKTQYGEQDHFPVLPSLRTLSISVLSNTLYASIANSRDMTAMCKCIRRIIHASPVESLSVELCGSHPASQMQFSVDGLIDSLARRHSRTLKRLRIQKLYVSVPRLQALCQKCVNLEQLEFSGRMMSLNTLQSLSQSLIHLHTVSIDFVIEPNVARKRDHQPLADETYTAMPRLRRLAICNQHFEGCWKNRSDTRQVEFKVTKVKKEKSDPWTLDDYAPSSYL